MSKNDRVAITFISFISLGMLWVLDIQSIASGNETGGFMLVFFTPVLLITTAAVSIVVGKVWAEKS